MTNIVPVTIRDILPGLKNITVTFIVLDIGKATQTKENHTVRSCRIADKSASINLSIWDDIGELLQPGDICRITKGYTSIWKGSLTLYISKGGEILKIGEFCMLFTEQPNMSEINTEFLNVKSEQLSQLQPQYGSLNLPSQSPSIILTNNASQLNNDGNLTEGPQSSVGTLYSLSSCRTSSAFSNDNRQQRLPNFPSTSPSLDTNRSLIQTSSSGSTKRAR